MSSKPYNRGFTLVEMLVTVSVLAILVGIAVPSFQSSLDKRRLTGATEQLVSNMQFARAEAVKRDTPIIVSFTQGANWCYGLNDTGVCNCAVLNSCQVDGVTQVFDNTAAQGVSLTTNFNSAALGANNTSFLPKRGIPLPGALGTVRLTSANGSVVNAPLSGGGRIILCSPAGEGQIRDYPKCP